MYVPKWLGEEKFPVGVFGQWPPQVPQDLIAECTEAERVDIKALAPTSLPLAPSQDDAHVPPHLRIGSAASSSSSGAPLPKHAGTV